MTTNVALDPQLYRQSVSLFATGIVVVTVNDADGNLHGVTVNSFTSVSLEPPTVLVSLKPGTGHRLISERGHYGVSVLSRDQWSHSRYFSGRREGVELPGTVPGQHVPTLAGSLARFECEVTSTVDVHDHTLFIARVVACESAADQPLIFFASAPHELAASA